MNQLRITGILSKIMQQGRLVFAATKFRVMNPERNLVISDSHGSFLIHNRPINSKPQGNWWTFWLGPKTFYSISKKGIVLEFEQKIVLYIICPQKVFICFGEIDIRTRLGNVTFNAFDSMHRDFILNIQKFVAENKILTLKFLEPPPPVRSTNENPEFPFAGSFESRLSAHITFFTALKQYLLSSEIDFIDFPNKLRASSGELQGDYCVDGCHLSESGNRIWKTCIIDSSLD